MNTNKIISIIVLLVIFTGTINTGCRKNKEKADPSTLTQLSKDESDIQASADEAATDASDVLSRDNAKSIEGFPCNATLDSIITNNDTITYILTYNGLNCHGGRLREGVVKVSKQINSHWRDAGATVKLTFVNLKITKVATGRYIILNGTKTLININGGVIRELNGSGEVVHSAIGSLSAEFDDGATRIWNISRKRTFSGTQTEMIVSVEGTGNSDGYNNLVSWGTNRNGETFYSRITTPVVRRQACDWDPMSGVKIINIPADDKSATITFGYDASGNIVSNNNCPTHCKVEWVKGNYSGTMLHAI